MRRLVGGPTTRSGLGLEGFSDTGILAPPPALALKQRSGGANSITPSGGFLARSGTHTPPSALAL